jgi:hypothetical protein
VLSLLESRVTTPGELAHQLDAFGICSVPIRSRLAVTIKVSGRNQVGYTATNNQEIQA